MTSDDHDHDRVPRDAGQGGGTGGTLGNESSLGRRSDDPGAEGFDGDPDDAWDAKPADRDRPPSEREATPTGDRGSAGEDVGRTEDGPGAP